MRWPKSAASAPCAAARNAEVRQRQGAPVVVRALGKLGEPQHIDAILPMLARPERESAS